MNVVITHETLFRRRIAHVEHFLRPIRRQPHVHCQFYRPQYGGGKVLASHDGESDTSDFHSWRCRTTKKELWFTYFELWKETTDRATWFLDRAYFHLYRADRDTRSLVQILGVHADPNCTDAMPLRLLKRGPHVHVLMAEEPLPACHFPLNFGHLQNVLSSSPRFTRAIRDAVQVLADDVIVRFA